METAQFLDKIGRKNISWKERKTLKQVKMSRMMMKNPQI